MGLRSTTKTCIFLLFMLVVFQWTIKAPFASSNKTLPIAIEPLPPLVVLAGEKTIILSRPRFKTPNGRIIVGVIKPKDQSLFISGLRRFGSFADLIGKSGSIINSGRNLTYNCHSYSLGIPIGLSENIWLDGMISPITEYTNPVAAIIDNYYTPVLTLNDPAVVSDSWKDPKVKSGDVLLLMRHRGDLIDYPHSMVLVQKKEKGLFESKLGEDYLVMTELSPILHEFEGLYDSAIYVRIKPEVSELVRAQKEELQQP